MKNSRSFSRFLFVILCYKICNSDAFQTSSYTSNLSFPWNGSKKSSSSIDANHNDNISETPSSRPSPSLSSSQDRPNTNDYKSIFLNDAPLLDVRAEVEYEKGAFPQSVNVPILDDEQRTLVGTCYKQEGPEAAFQLGRSLMTPEVQIQRLQEWKHFLEEHPNGDGYLYCFRGGARSNIVQTELQKMTGGAKYPLVIGGYKAMRRFLIDDMEQSIKELPIVMVGGRTGSGKTHLLKRFERFVDLEGLANHRGSSFGGLVEEEPSQINFENTLAIALLKVREESSSLPVFIEEEGRRIGRRMLPLSLHQAMLDRYPTIILETPMEERVQTCIQDYVTDLFPHFLSSYAADEAYVKFRKKQLDGLDRIKKKLGPTFYEIITRQVSEALDVFEASNGQDISGFEEPTETLLREYYDPMYDYQSHAKRKGDVLYQGNAQELLDWVERYMKDH
mmetsp:Transcript_777/g.1216  ORF Transcript_777/g.1216 Transcript_777/m.1216 type:complete len:448 (-) Transcript_777:4264-5607(-)